jgi:hypothetical protein
MKIKNQKITAQYCASFQARGPALLAWPSGTVVQQAHASRRGAHAFGVVTARWPRARRRCGAAGGLGVMRPAA